MATDVLCEVDSCSYWATGNRCDATRIYVVTSRNTDEASKSEETDCKTFEKKEEDIIS